VTAPSRRSRLPFLILLSVLVIVLDRVTKLWVADHIPIGDALVVIPNIFRITHVLNSGAAFSLFAESANPNTVRWFLIAFSVIAALLVFAFLVKIGHQFTATTVALALILGGAIGNLYDRIRLASVIDFLEVHIFHYHWPDFNCADSAIVVGGILLLIESLRPTEKTE
jgi:signal peptidase II